MPSKIETEDKEIKYWSNRMNVNYIEDNDFQHEILLDKNGYGLWISKAIGGILCLGSLKNGEFAFEFKSMSLTPDKALYIASKLTEWAQKRSNELASNQ